MLMMLPAHTRLRRRRRAGRAGRRQQLPLGGRPVAGVGPITVDPPRRRVRRPPADGGRPRARAASSGFAGVRLVQAAFNTRSMSLYTKLGFDVREPLVCMQRRPASANRSRATRCARRRRPTSTPCGDVCRRVHGHDRAGELRGAAQGRRHGRRARRAGRRLRDRHRLLRPRRRARQPRR